MVEGIMKKFYGFDCYIQFVGVKNDLEIDGFVVVVCDELGVEFYCYCSWLFDEMEEWGDDLLLFDFVLVLLFVS